VTPLVDVFSIRDTVLTPAARFEITGLSVAAQNLGKTSLPPSFDPDLLRAKVRTLLFMAVQSNCDALVLGALGCGAFKNKPEDVALAFWELLVPKGAEFHRRFATIEFAIINQRSQDNLTPFREQFPLQFSHTAMAGADSPSGVVAESAHKRQRVDNDATVPSAQPIAFGFFTGQTFFRYRLSHRDETVASGFVPFGCTDALATTFVAASNDWLADDFAAVDRLLVVVPDDRKSSRSVGNAELIPIGADSRHILELFEASRSLPANPIYKAVCVASGTVPPVVVVWYQWDTLIVFRCKTDSPAWSLTTLQRLCRDLGDTKREEEAKHRLVKQLFIADLKKGAAKDRLWENCCEWKLRVPSQGPHKNEPATWLNHADDEPKLRVALGMSAEAFLSSVLSLRRPAGGLDSLLASGVVHRENKKTLWQRLLVRPQTDGSMNAALLLLRTPSGLRVVVSGNSLFDQWDSDWDALWVQDLPLGDSTRSVGAQPTSGSGSELKSRLCCFLSRLTACRDSKDSGIVERRLAALVGGVDFSGARSRLVDSFAMSAQHGTCMDVGHGLAGWKRLGEASAAFLADLGLGGEDAASTSLAHLDASCDQTLRLEWVDRLPYTLPEDAATSAAAAECSDCFPASAPSDPGAADKAIERKKAYLVGGHWPLESGDPVPRQQRCFALVWPDRPDEPPLLYLQEGAPISVGRALIECRLAVSEHKFVSRKQAELLVRDGGVQVVAIAPYSNATGVKASADSEFEWLWSGPGPSGAPNGAKTKMLRHGGLISLRTNYTDVSEGCVLMVASVARPQDFR
jgi:hypothetical protein